MAAYQKKIYQQTLSNARSNQSFLFRNHRTALCRKNKIYMCLSVYFFNPFLVCLIFHYRINIPFFAKLIDENGVFQANEVIIKSAEHALVELKKWSEALKPMRNK